MGCHPQYHGHPHSPDALAVHSESSEICPHSPDSEFASFLLWDEAIKHQIDSLISYQTLTVA